MNRSERRRMIKGKENVRPTLMFDDYAYYYNLAMADALYCELGMSSEQIQAVFIKVNETTKCLKSGNLNADDLQYMCKEELGIEFLKSVGGRVKWTT